MVVLGVVSAAHAAPGDLDTTFSGDGKIVETGLASSSANAVAIQADGKIVVVGGAADDFVVLRYNRNGAPDSTFGGDGLVTTSFGSNLSIDVARAVAIQSDGKIVVVGSAGSASNPRVGLARYNPNGSLDTTFSGDGIHTMEFAMPGGGAQGVAIQADGRIVIVGSTGTDFAVARFNADGTLDTTFGFPTPTGIVIRDFGSTSEGAVAVAVLADGRIVVAGTTVFNGQSVFAWDYISTGGVVQFVGLGLTGNGAQHASFGGGTSAFTKSMAIQTDGKIVLVGDVTFASGIPGSVDRNIAIARYNTDGTMDTSFSGSGLRGIDFGPQSSGRAVAIQPDGKIAVLGNVQPFEGGFPNANFAAARLRVGGSLDTTFSGDGLLSTDFGGTPNDDFGGAVAIQPRDGRIVAAGESAGAVALARYHAFACNGANVTILGTNGPDTIFGTDKPNVIEGLGGNDTINGLGGNDNVCGGPGNDTLNGGFGNDTLVAGLGKDTLNGGDGSDIGLGSNLDPIKDPIDTFNSCETINTGGAGLSGEWLKIGQHCNRSQRNPQCRLNGSLRVFNPGTETTAVATEVGFYLSADDVLDEDDLFLTTENVRALDIGGQDVTKLKLKLADGADASRFYVIAVVDFFDNVSEGNEANNVAVSPIIFQAAAGRGKQ